MKNVVKAIVGFAFIIFGILANTLTISILDHNRINKYGVLNEINRLGVWFDFLFFLGIVSIIVGFALLIWSFISEHFNRKT